MKLSHTLQIAVATAVCTAATAQSAIAGGEPKNTSSFTRPATESHSPEAAAILSASTIATARTAIAGESKYEQTFTRRLNHTDALTRFLFNQNSQLHHGALAG